MCDFEHFRSYFWIYSRIRSFKDRFLEFSYFETHAFCKKWPSIRSLWSVLVPCSDRFAAEFKFCLDDILWRASSFYDTEITNNFSWKYLISFKKSFFVISLKFGVQLLGLSAVGVLLSNISIQPIWWESENKLIFVTSFVIFSGVPYFSKKFWISNSK